MRILVSAASMVRMVVVCFVLGIALGVYFGVAGTPSVVRPAVGGADRSVHITAPVKVQIDVLTLDGRFDIVLLSTGRVVSMLLGFSVGDPIPAPQLVHLTQLLLDRQQG